MAKIEGQRRRSGENVSLLSHLCFSNLSQTCTRIPRDSEMAVALVESLRSLLKFKAPMISEAQHELKRLEDGVRHLNAFLGDADRNQARELDLERQIKELVYDVEDILESWSIYLAANNTTGGRDFLLNDILERVFQKKKDILEREIKSIRHDRLDPMDRMLRAYTDLQLRQKQPTKPHQVPSVQLNREVPSKRLKNSVGLEDEADTLITSLLEETEELDVISITGMPGIGKTTLAWKIYQNDKIRSEFPTRIWVDIPFHFRSKDLYLNILEEFFKQGMVGYEELVMWLGMPQESCSKVSFLDILNEFIESGMINDSQLVSGVRACFEKSRFLLVVDDVWTANTIASIRHFLPNSGKVLITSLNNRVTGKPHMLRFLNEKESWDLLQMEVFGKLDECPEILKSMGECIAKNCDGSPLAIVAVGTSLGVTSSAVTAAYLNEKWWKKVSENVILYVTDYDEQRVFKSVEVSYIKLTQCQQDCFLYLGVFPQGCEISVRTFLRLWIAERLVKEEIAEETFYHLIDRNLVMVGKIYPNGQIRTCRLHKLMYGFCKYKAAEQGFYHEIKVSGGGALDRLISLAPNHRRLCIYSHLYEFLSCTPKERCVRSILCLNKEDKVVLHPKDSSTIHKCFKSLRVMEFKYVSFTKFPHKLTKMMLLRYISLSCDDLDFIPEAISSLCYLETLVVDTQSRSLKLKANIWRMFQLRHLVTNAAIVLSIPREGEAGKNLQTLSRLAPASCMEDVFTRAYNLKTLGIRGALAALSDANSLRKLEFLEKLKLINEPAADSELPCLFHPDCFPPNLKRLTLSGTHLGWESMSILGKIDNLEILKLKNNAFAGESWKSTDADGFGRLEFLMIGTTDLVSWEASPHCFPNLKCLVLNKCEKLHKIPSSLAKSLDTLDVENVSQSAAESAREIKQIQGGQVGRLNELKLSIHLGSE